MKRLAPLTMLTLLASFTVVMVLLSACESATQPAEGRPSLSAEPQLSLTVLSEHGIPVTVLGYGEAHSINERGQVGGYSWNAAGERIAVMWDDGEMIDLGAPAGQNLSAVGINDRGQIVISAVYPELGDAYFWEDGELSLIARDARVTAINARGQVTGMPDSDPGHDIAFVWKDGQFTHYIDPPTPYMQTRALALNDAGTAVGLTNWGGPTRGIVWENGATQSLTTPEGYQSRARGINNRGDIVGRLTSPSGVEHASIWRNGALIDLGTLGGAAEPSYHSRAIDINDLMKTVGWSQIPPIGWTRPFLWPGPGGEMIDLGRPLGPEYAGPTEAHAINNRGQVVGSGGWVLRAYIWHT